MRFCVFRPLTVIDGGDSFKPMKIERNYTGIYAAKNLHGLFFVLTKRTGKCSIFYSANAIMPNSSKERVLLFILRLQKMIMYILLQPNWDFEPKVQLLSLARIKLDSVLGTIKEPADAANNKEYQEYCRYRELGSPKAIFHSLAPAGRVVLKFFNKIYAVDIEWVRQFEENLAKRTLSSQLYKRSSIKTQLALLAEMDTPPVTQALIDSKKFDISDYAFYGLQVRFENQ